MLARTTTGRPRTVKAGTWLESLQHTQGPATRLGYKALAHTAGRGLHEVPATSRFASGLFWPAGLRTPSGP